MASTGVRVFWSLFLICMLEMVSWSMPMSILCHADTQSVDVQDFFLESTASMRRLDFRAHSEDAVRSSVEASAPAEPAYERSAAPSSGPSMLVLGASLTLALTGGLGFLGASPAARSQTRASSSSSSSAASSSSSSDDGAEGAELPVKGTTLLPAAATTRHQQPPVPSPLLFAGALLAGAASMRRPSAATPTLAARLFSSSRGALAVPPPSPFFAPRSPATVGSTVAAASSSSSEAAARVQSQQVPLGSVFSPQQQKLLREALRGADSEIVRLLRSGSLAAEELHQTVADLVDEAVRPRLDASKPDPQLHGAASSTPPPLHKLSDKVILDKLRAGEVQQHQLEHAIGDLERAVYIRRKWFVQQEQFSQSSVASLPFENYDYQKVIGACCENVLGYVPIPMGLAGPVLINGEPVPLPMATTEGCLVASTHRGTKAINESGGASAAILADGMTRAPVVRMPTAIDAARLKNWLEKPENYQAIVESFNSTSRFARVQSIKATVAGCSVYLRFKAKTGDAMGMNMISKGVEKALGTLRESFPDMAILALSGNMCTDKKPSAINWVEGRGKSVVVEAIIKGDIVKRVLKTTVSDMILLNQSKNLIGSAMAGSIGGYNAHAANIVTAMFLATGQDPAQNVESSNCMTLMESRNDGQDLWISCTMPSIEVGTVGGGTHLPAQEACLKMMGVRGSHAETPGANAQQLAMAVATGVLAGELSLMAALAEGSLVRSHLKLNRKNV